MVANFNFNRDQNDFVHFMKHAELWPRWPVLPVKKRVDGQFPICAVMFDGLPKPTVFLANLCMVENGKMTATELYKGQHWVYESFEALVADGWEVD